MSLNSGDHHFAFALVMSTCPSPKVDRQVLCDEKVDDRLRIGPVGREGGNPSC